MDNRYEIAEQNGMSREFADWFFDKKKDGCGDVWFAMMAAMWEGWQGFAAMLQGAENAESRCTIQTAPVLDSLLKKAESRCSNSPMALDGWVACVERMPSAGEKVLAYRPDAPESNDPLIKMATYVGGSAHGHGFDCYCKPTHWMPLPAEPQQEVTQALAKGMERYGDAMQKLADSGD